jgi:hypothetical protein
VQRELELIKTNPAARILVLTALRLNRDPLETLGIPPHLRDLPETAVTLLELSKPGEDPEMADNLDAQAQAVQERMDREEAWEAALHGEYEGPRCQYRPKVRLAPFARVRPSTLKSPGQHD